MKTALTAIAAAGVFALASVSAIDNAQAGCNGNCALGWGILGGVAAGAIVGGAIANSPPPYAAYAPAPGYAYYPAYAAPYPVACPGGYWARRPMVDQWGNVVGYTRPRFFCP
jgi:hypothetical protein